MTTPIAHDDRFLSSIEAGKRFGYSNDYIARLAREQKIIGRQAGRQWLIEIASLEQFLAEADRAKKAHAEKVRESRRKEREAYQARAPQEPKASAVAASLQPPMVAPLPPRVATLAKTGIVVAMGAFVGVGMYLGAPLMHQGTAQSAGIFEMFSTLASRVYHFGNEAPVVTVSVEKLAEPAHDGAETVSGAPSEGLIVYPDDGTRDPEEIAESFSDDVTVTEDPDGKSGIITPQFKEGEGDPYRYLIVPIDVP